MILNPYDTTHEVDHCSHIQHQKKNRVDVLLMLRNRGLIYCIRCEITQNFCVVSFK